MESVEKTATAIASPPGVGGDHVRGAKPYIETEPRADAAVTAPAAPAAGDWAALMQTGLAWLEQLARFQLRREMAAPTGSASSNAIHNRRGVRQDSGAESRSAERSPPDDRKSP